MPRKKTASTDSSRARSERLRTQPKDELVALLDELAAKHPEVEARLARHALAADQNEAVLKEMIATQGAHLRTPVYADVGWIDL